MRAWWSVRPPFLLHKRERTFREVIIMCQPTADGQFELGNGAMIYKYALESI